VQRAESIARSALGGALATRHSTWSVSDFRTQYFGATNSHGRSIVGIGIHQRLLDPVRLGLRRKTGSELDVLSSTPIFVCDAGAMQFVGLFDEDGAAIEPLRFADALHGAPE
jgi:hypothetical protein